MISFHGWESAIIFWGAIAAIMVAGSYFRYKSQASHHRLLETMAEKGQQIPTELLTRNRDYYRYHSPIQSGIVMMCIGIALFVFFWAMTGGGNYFDGERMPNWLPFVGIFPFMIGLARFLGGIFDRPRDK
jgi:hypothetical protein